MKAIANSPSVDPPRFCIEDRDFYPYISTLKTISCSFLFSVLLVLISRHLFFICLCRVCLASARVGSGVRHVRGMAARRLAGYLLMELWMEEEENKRKADEFRMRRQVCTVSNGST